MNMRKVTSMTLIISLIVLVVNSIVLYVVPEGRVAYWADWRFWGLSKTEWGDQHVTVGFLFLIAGLLHIYYNWKPIVAYMKNKAREIRVFTGAFNVALILTVLVVIGTYYRVQPMEAILELGSSFKEAGSLKYGEPPYGHAELSSLKMFASKENLDLEQSLVLLTASGLSEAEPEITIKEAARKLNVTPQQLYNIIKPAALQQPVANATGGFPEAPQPGWGNKSLAEAMAPYHLDLERLVQKLADQGVMVTPAVTVKENAKANNMEPMQLFEAIQAIVTAQRQ